MRYRVWIVALVLQYTDPFTFHPTPFTPIVIYDMHQLPKNLFLASTMEKAAILLNWIEDTYGSPEELAKILDYGIEMLFYLEADTFDRKEVQNVVAAIRGIVVGLRE